ncbi:hypothetical protein CABS02_14103 [Colletotrichum abscissum]|uniref:Uncharacterized protein n=1 Tax=Colletotrichum abscissum TaxID=1671311 RepID=A0A9P9X200_9PEZI|nr:hypothetical protein CABS02_14103 [Colletotrichum abscissum]
MVPFSAHLPTQPIHPPHLTCTPHIPSACCCCCCLLPIVCFYCWCWC